MSYQVMGFHLAYSKSGVETIIKQDKILDKVLPTWIEVESDGSINTDNSKEEIVNYIEKKDIVPMVQNANLSSRVSNDLISSEEAIDNFIINILSYLNQENYYEICIDIEGVKYKKKEKYTEFIRKLSDVLHHNGYSLNIVVPAKSENNQDSTWSGAYDYSSLSEIVDKIIIMAYDFHWSGGPPGPIAPLSWVQDVIDYAIIEVPLEKLYIGIGLYGYDWVINNEDRAKGLVYSQIMKLSSKYSAKVEWDQESQSPYLKYNENDSEHEVWFENKESISKKLKLVEEFHLEGLVFWRLGQGDPDVWKLFNKY